MNGKHHQSLKSAQKRYQYDEQFSPTVQLERDFLPVAIKHGMELWWDDSSPKKRLDRRNGSNGFSRFVNARVEGKLAEVALSQCLFRTFGIDSAVDWRIYGDYDETDDGDLQYLLGNDGNEYAPNVAFDVKKTKPWNQWLAIRDTTHRRLDDDAPIILTKLEITDDINLDPFEDYDCWSDVDEDEEFRERLLDFADAHFPLNVDVVGTIYPDEFTDFFEEGDRLYYPDSGAQLGPELRCDNHGIHVRDLDQRAARWNRVVDDIVGDSPVDWDPLLIVDE